VARDITEQQHSEELRARLAAIVDSSEDTIVSKTVDGVNSSWNHGAKRLFGYSEAEAIGQHIFLIIPDDRRAEEEDVLARARRGEKVVPSNGTADQGRPSRAHFVDRLAAQGFAREHHWGIEAARDPSPRLSPNSWLMDRRYAWNVEYAGAFVDIQHLLDATTSTSGSTGPAPPTQHLGSRRCTGCGSRTAT
jgi:hypothetical protein